MSPQWIDTRTSLVAMCHWNWMTTPLEDLFNSGIKLSDDTLISTETGQHRCMALSRQRDRVSISQQSPASLGTFSFRFKLALYLLVFLGVLAPVFVSPPEGPTQKMSWTPRPRKSACRIVATPPVTVTVIPDTSPPRDPKNQIRRTVIPPPVS